MAVASPNLREMSVVFAGVPVRVFPHDLCGGRRKESKKLICDISQRQGRAGADISSFDYNQQFCLALVFGTT